MRTTVWTGCCLVPAILLLRALFPRLPRRILVLLWAGALAVLLVPGRLSSPLSIYNLLPRAAAAEVGTTAPPASQGGLWLTLRRVVTGLGLSGLLVFYGLGLLRLRRARPAEDPAVQGWLAAHPLLRPLRICVGKVPAPVCGGILLPRIVLPKDMELSDRAQLDCVLTHEYTHVRRFDPLLKLLFAAALCLRWYDPRVWIVALTAGRDMEYACDEAVLDTGVCPRSYAASLLRAALRRSEFLPATARFNAGKTERRVDRVCAYRSRSGLCWLAAGLLSLGLLLCFGTAPRSADAAAPVAVPIRTREEPVVLSACLQEQDPERAAYYAELAAQWTQAALDAADPYAGLTLLKEENAVPLCQTRETMDELCQSTGANYLRVTDEKRGFCTVRGYTEPSDGQTPKEG